MRGLFYIDFLLFMMR